MMLQERLTEYVRACFTALWVRSHEHEEAIAAMSTLCREQRWRLAVWDIEQGLRGGGLNTAPPEPPSPETATAGTGGDPLAPLRALEALEPGGDDGGEPIPTLIVLVNYHRFLQSPEIVQALSRQIQEGKQRRSILVILAPVVQVPTELERQFTIIEHELPDRSQLDQIVRDIATEEGELPEGEQLDRLLDAAAGLTRVEAENAASLSLVRHGRLSPEVMWELKAAALTQGGLLSLHCGGESFRDLGGLDALKAFCLQALAPPSSSEDDGETAVVRPRGVLLLSPPGCGKSQFAKALGREAGRPTLHLDIGRLMGSLVGQSEQRTREALAIADAMAPCVLMVDEIEKALAGAATGASGDSGVSSRMFGTLLTWLNDHESDVFLVATCNDISKLPPEFARAERFDGVFFIDLPDAAQRQAIWCIYLSMFGLDESQQLPDDRGWTGAEIRSCCRLARLLDQPLLEAAAQVVPISATAGESIDKLRQWATGRCLSADLAGIYHAGRSGDAGPGSSSRRRRRVSGGQSNN